MKCHSDPDPGNLLVSTLRPDREDLVRKWARPRLSRAVSCAQCYRRRALSFASQRRRGQLWNVGCLAVPNCCNHAPIPQPHQSLLQSSHGPVYLAAGRGISCPSRVSCRMRRQACASCRLRYPVTCCSNVRSSISFASVGTYRSRHFSRWYLRLRRHPPAGGVLVCSAPVRYNELSLVTDLFRARACTHALETLWSLCRLCAGSRLHVQPRVVATRV